MHAELIGAIWPCSRPSTTAKTPPPGSNRSAAPTTRPPTRRDPSGGDDGDGFERTTAHRQDRVRRGACSTESAPVTSITLAMYSNRSLRTQSLSSSAGRPRWSPPPYGWRSSPRTSWSVRRACRLGSVRHGIEDGVADQGVQATDPLAAQGGVAHQSRGSASGNSSGFHNLSGMASSDHSCATL